MCSSNTCDMYMCRLRHINDSVLSSLKMEGIRLLFNIIDACIGHTCNTTRVQHDTIIPYASSYSVCYHYLSSPHSFLQQATPHIRLRNLFQGQRCEKQRNQFWRHDLTARCPRSYDKVALRHINVKKNIWINILHLVGVIKEVFGNLRLHGMVWSGTASSSFSFHISIPAYNTQCCIDPRPQHGSLATAEHAKGMNYFNVSNLLCSSCPGTLRDICWNDISVRNIQTALLWPITIR
jgi:hypothetical protein